VKSNETVRHGPSEYPLDSWDWDQLRQVADEHGTPVYAYDLDRLVDNYQRLESVLDDWTVKYAAKANWNGAVVSTLRDIGAKLVCASPFEFRRFLDLGVPVEDIQYTAVHPSDEYVQRVCALSTESGGGAATETAATVTVGSLDTLEKFLAAGFEGDVFVRVNSNYLTDDDTLTPHNAKFGIPPARVSRAVARLGDEPASFVGLHVHTGEMSTAEEMEEFYTVVENTAQLVSELSVRVERLDLGGGLRVPFARGDTPVDLPRVYRTVERLLSGFDGRVVLEPGKYVVADAGTTLTTVTSVKETPVGTVVGVDLPAHLLPSPVMWEEPHRLYNLSAPDAPERTQTVSGPSCTWYNGYIGLERRFSESSVGDCLGVNMTGAYGHSMASTFHMTPRPPIVALRNGRATLVRERDSLETVVGPERELSDCSPDSLRQY
jgi:diaminopimelate decarboxylase